MFILKNKIKSIFNKEVEKKIDFIICGTQKGGTTALDFYLRSHPEVCMAKKKEVHFFDNDSNFKSEKNDYTKYHNYFKPLDSHKIIGEATPIYMYWKSSIQRIYNYNPNIKLIIILRNPISRAFSHWNMEKNKRNEKRSFHDSIQSEFSNFNKNYVYGENRNTSYLERGLYSKQITQIFEYFDKSQLMILQNESLRNTPNIVLDDVSKYLSISPFKEVQHKEIHSNQYNSTIEEKDFLFLQEYYNDEISLLEGFLKWDLSGWKN